MTTKALIRLDRVRIRFSMLLVVLLLVMIAEAVVLILQHQGVALLIAQVIVTAFRHIGQSGAVLWEWIWKMVGPVVFPLFALTLLEIWSFFKLLECKIFNYEAARAHRHLRSMEIIEGSAPGFGFLGTCIALIATMKGMDPQLNQIQMLKAVLDNSSSAFGSTVYGILLAVSAFITKELFRGVSVDKAS